MKNIKGTVGLIAGAGIAAGAVLAVMPLWNGMWDACWGAHKNAPVPPPQPAPVTKS